jgi:hypothetical protein
MVADIILLAMHGYTNVEVRIILRYKRHQTSNLHKTHNNTHIDSKNQMGSSYKNYLHLWDTQLLKN